MITEGPTGTLGSLAAFARGTDQAVWYTVRTPSGWGSWTKLGGQLYPGTSPAAMYVGSTVYVVAVGTDQRVYVDETSDGARWSRWSLIGGKVNNNGGDPAATGPTSSTGVVFVRGTDNAVWYYEFAGGNPGWHSLGGQLDSGVGATTDPAGKTYLFVLGTDFQVWEASGTFPAIGSWSRAQ